MSPRPASGVDGARRGNFPPLAVTMGDPAGIGPDITLAAWLARRAQALPTFVVFGDGAVLADRAAALGVDVAIAAVDDLAHGASLFDKRLPVRAVSCPAAV